MTRQLSTTDDGLPIYVFLIDKTPAKYLELSIQAVKYVKRNEKNAHIGLIGPPDSEDLTQIVTDRLKEINADGDVENIHWVEGRTHFDDWDNTQRILDIELFVEEFDPIIFLHSDSAVMADVSHYVKKFLESGKKYGFINGYLQYPSFDEKWEGLKFIPSTSFQMYRAAALEELIPVWKNQWKAWIEIAPFVNFVNPARCYKYSKLSIGEYALSKVIQGNFDADVYEIPRQQLYVVRNLAVDVQKSKRKFLGAGSSYSNDGASKITLKVKDGKVNEGEDTYVEVQVGDSVRKTKTIYGTNEPVWNKEFIYRNPAIYGDADKILFTLWNNPKPKPKPKPTVQTRSFGGPYPGVAQVTLDIVSGVVHNKHDVVGEDDPYVKVKIGGVEKQTKHVLNTNTPQWNETLTFDDVVSDDAQQITITVWDWDRFTKHDLVGTATLNLLPYNGNKQRVTVTLIGGEDNATEEGTVEIDALVTPANAEGGEGEGGVASRSYPATAAAAGGGDSGDEGGGDSSNEVTASEEKLVIGTAKLSLLDKKTHDAEAAPTSVTLSVVDGEGVEKGTLNVEGVFYVEVLPEEGDDDDGGQPKTRSFTPQIGGPYKGVADVTLKIVSGVIHHKHDVIGEDDAYVKVNIGGVEKQTNHVPSTNTPQWNETLQYSSVVSNDAQNVTVTVWDWDAFTNHDLVGTATLNLLPYNGNNQTVTVSLINPTSNAEEATINIEALLTVTTAFAGATSAAAAAVKTTTATAAAAAAAPPPPAASAVAVAPAKTKEGPPIPPPSEAEAEAEEEEQQQQQPPAQEQAQQAQQAQAQPEKEQAQAQAQAPPAPVPVPVPAAVPGVEDDQEYPMGPQRPNDDKLIGETIFEIKSATIKARPCAPQGGIEESPYIVLRYKGQEVSTSVKNNTYNPTYNETLKLVNTESTSVIDILAFVKDEAGGDHFIGSTQTTIRNIDDVKSQRKREYSTYSLTNVKKVTRATLAFTATWQPVWGPDDVVYDMVSPPVDEDGVLGKLDVEVNVGNIPGRPSAQDVRFGGEESPYFVLNINGEEKKTAVKANTKSANWNEKYQVQNAQRTSLISVWAYVKDNAGGDHFIGSGQFRVRDAFSYLGEQGSKRVDLKNKDGVVKGDVSIYVNFTVPKVVPINDRNSEYIPVRKL